MMIMMKKMKMFCSVPILPCRLQPKAQNFFMFDEHRTVVCWCMVTDNDNAIGLSMTNSRIPSFDKVCY